MSHACQLVMMGILEKPTFPNTMGDQSYKQVDGDVRVALILSAHFPAQSFPEVLTTF